MSAKVTSWNETLRHELIHAFFFEAGLVEYCSDETLVYFIAQQFPKLHKIFYRCRMCDVIEKGHNA